jgi:hypothetical protein
LKNLKENEVTYKEKCILEQEFIKSLQNLVSAYLKLNKFESFETCLDTHEPIKEIYDIKITRRVRVEKTLNPKIKQGEWVFDSNFTEFGNPYGTYRCSCCDGHSSDKYSFCKDCGADMRGERE